MEQSDLIYFIDISVIAILYVLAHLSQRLGEAQKTPPFYLLFHISSLLIIISALINAFSMSEIITINDLVAQTLPMGMRLVAGIFSVFSSFYYWTWLIPALIKN